MGRSSSSFSSRRFWKGTVLPMMRKLLVQSRILPRSSKAKGGHFVVIATQGWKPERFCIELGYLDHPEFLKLLNQAEEEFGFSQVGALAIPCEPDHLKKIIGRT